MEISKTEIGNALTSADENHILATANDIYDETQQAYQSEINQSLAEGKQDKLVSGENIKTINGTSLLGSGDVVVSGDSTGDVDEGRLVWSEEAVPQGTIIDGIMYNAHQNGLAFMNPSCIDVYYSIDNGDTWQDYGLTTTQKLYLVTPVTGNYSLYLGKDSTNKSVNYRLRVDLRIKDADIQFTGKKLYLKWLSNTPSDAYYIDISVLKYENYESNEWTHVGTFHKKNTLTIPLNEEIGYNGARGILSLRIEAYRTGTTEPRYNSALTNIAFLYTTYTKGNNFGKTGLPMTIDTSQNSIFPAYIKARKFIPNGGKSTQVLKGDGSLEEESALAVASAIDAEHAIEADYAGVADKADKLTTARTISLSGGAVGTATAFDGSKNIDISVTKMYDSYISWGGTLVSANISPLDATSPMFSANRFAFFPPENINVEYSTDGGSTWQDYGATSQSKILFTTPELGPTNYKVGNKTGSYSASDMVRVTFNGEGCYRYARLNKILLNVIHCSAAAKAYITVESETYSGTIRENTYKYVLGNPGWNSIPLMYDFPFGNSNQAYVIKRLTITLKVESNATSVPILRNIFAIGSTSYIAQYPFDKCGHIYSFDENQNATFPAEIRGTKHITIGGTSEQLVLGNGGLKKISDITDGFICSIDNIVSKLTKGGNTTVNGNVVTTNGENRDTYFLVGTSEPIDTSIPYTLGFYIEGLTEGTRWDFNLGGIRIYAVNGYCWATGYFNSTQEGKTSIICDDGLRPSGSLSITISKITLRKGTLRVYDTDAYIKKQGTNQQAVLGDGSLIPLSELSPITDADADILLDNHIHSIDVKASGEDVNINIIESTKNGNAWETTEKNVTIPVATQETAGVISAADKKKINAINYKDNTIFVGDGMDGTLSIGHESSKASSEMRVFHDRYATIHVTSYNDTTGGSIVAMDSMGGKGTVEVNGDQLAELSLSGAGQVCATLTKKNEDGTKIKTIIDAAEGITAPKLATIGGTSEQILLGDGTLITFDELKAKLGLI